LRFFVIRHGETVWNAEGRFQGQKDTELNANGVRQAELLANRLAGHKFEAIVTSPLARAAVTARKISDSSGCRNFIIEERLTEINHGDWEGRLADEIAEKWPELLRTWHTKPETVKMPGDGGESLEDVRRRAVDAACAIAKQHAGDVLLVSHDAVIKVLLCSWLDAPLSSFWRFQIPNCSITVVEAVSGKEPRMLLMGDASHIGSHFDRPEQKGL